MTDALKALACEALDADRELSDASLAVINATEREEKARSRRAKALLRLARAVLRMESEMIATPAMDGPCISRPSPSVGETWICYYDNKPYTIECIEPGIDEGQIVTYLGDDGHDHCERLDYFMSRTLSDPTKWRFIKKEKPDELR